jgi:quercetin dioxygenase-like cupin family protein
MCLFGSGSRCLMRAPIGGRVCCATADWAKVALPLAWSSVRRESRETRGETMYKKLLGIAPLALLTLNGFAVADSAAQHEVLASAAAVKWGPPPPMFPAGARFAVIDGDPTVKGLVTVRFQMPAGYKIAPHWHPADEHITVLSGTFGIGMGDTFDIAHGKTLGAGGFAVAPATMHHYAWTKTGATIQVHLIGPFAITYVNPADDPSQNAKK